MFWWFQIKSIKIYLSFLKDRDSRVQGDLVSLLWSLTTSGSFSLIFFIFYAFREYVSNFSGHQYHLEGLWKHRFLGPAQELLLQSIWGEAQESVLPKSSPSDGDVAGPRPTLTNHLFSLLGKHCSWIQYFFSSVLGRKTPSDSQDFLWTTNSQTFKLFDGKQIYCCISVIFYCEE